MLDKTKNYKIDVSALNTVERITLQEELFKQGYKWYESGREVSELDANVLFLSPDMDISYGDKKDFNRYDYPILTLSDIMPQTEERTLRDWFAGLALNGILSNDASGIGSPDFKFDSRAQKAYLMADAMLKERNK